MKYFFMDTETGGLNAELSLLEFAYVITDEKLKEITRGQYLVRPESGIYTVTAEALDINKINLVDHWKFALTKEEISNQLIDVLRRETVFGREKLIPVGHNVAMDINFTNSHLLSKEEWNLYVSYRTLDTAGISLFLQQKGLLPHDLKLSLESLANYFGHNTAGNHRAMKDVELTIAVLTDLFDLI